MEEEQAKLSCVRRPCLTSKVDCELKVHRFALHKRERTGWHLTAAVHTPVSSTQTAYPGEEQLHRSSTSKELNKYAKCTKFKI